MLSDVNQYQFVGLGYSLNGNSMGSLQVAVVLSCISAWNLPVSVNVFLTFFWNFELQLELSTIRLTIEANSGLCSSIVKKQSIKCSAILVHKNNTRCYIPNNHFHIVLRRKDCDLFAFTPLCAIWPQNLHYYLAAIIVSYINTMKV